MRVVLRLASGEIGLVEGVYSIGRGSECHVVIDNPRVSRCHARLSVGQDRVVLEDLGSANGVVVDGKRLDAPQVLLDGSRIMLGGQEMVIRFDARPSHDDAARRETLHASSIPPRQSAPPISGAETERAGMLELAGAVADKALAAGRAEDAEGVLFAHLTKLLEQARAENAVPGRLAETAAGYALKLATATGHSKWLNYAVEVFAIARRPPPQPLIDQLRDLLRRGTPLDRRALRSYVTALQTNQRQFGTAERMLIDRLAELERHVGT